MAYKLNVCMVLPHNLPVPPVKGGAIETLVQYIADKNEEKNKINLTIISIWDEKAEILSQKYKHTKYVYYKWNSIDDFKYFIFRAFRKVCGWKIRYLEPYEYFVSKFVIKNKYDIFVNESADFTAFSKVSKALGRRNCFAHLHHEFSSNTVIDSSFGTIISVSEYIKKRWLNTSKIGAENVVVLRNCVDRERFCKVLTEKEKNSLRKRIGFSADDFLVCFCGRIIPEKGVLELIQAVEDINDEHIKVLIIGSPNFGNKVKTKYLESVEQKVKKSAGRIIFTGYIDNEDLYKYYGAADCFAFPSLCEEAAGLVLIESMMAGKAIILTNTGGAPEYIGGKDIAIIVIKEVNLISQLSAGITILKNDKKKRREMELAAIEHSKLYTTDIYYENFIQIIKERCNMGRR